MDGRGWNGAWGPGLVPPRPTPPPNPNLDAPPFVDGWPLPASTLNALFGFIGFRQGILGLAPGPYLPILGGTILGNLTVDGTLTIGGQPISGTAFGVTTSVRPPATPFDGQLWWDPTGGELYIRYNDGSSKQWVVTSPGGGVEASLVHQMTTMLDSIHALGATINSLVAHQQDLTQRINDLSNRIAVLEGR